MMNNGKFYFDDTIFALSTPVGGAIAVIRASGNESQRVLRRIFTGRIEAGRLTHGRIQSDSGVIDDIMAVFFQAPHSYTGEDMFELHLHGSYAIVNAATELLIDCGLRLAEAGEFTRRAFLNGKLDLVQADAVMDLINSETRRSAQAALDQLGGGLSRRIGAIEDGLISLGTELAAAMDYPEEMEDEVLSSVPSVLPPIIAELDALVENGRGGRLLREGAKLVILGRPNAGKSSLMNALLDTERAIVTDIAGTTRDVLEEKLSINGLPVRLVDTAGLREGDINPVERIGIDRANTEAESAECVLLVFDGTADEINEGDRAAIAASRGKSAVWIVNKCDLSEEKCEAFSNKLRLEYGISDAVTISTRTRFNLDALKERILKKLGAGEGGAIVTNARHIERLKFASKELRTALDESSTDLISALIDSALFALSEITGREFSSELLDNIFSRFCVGK